MGDVYYNIPTGSIKNPKNDTRSVVLKPADKVIITVVWDSRQLLVKGTNNK